MMNSQYNVIDLFCGCGGFSLGFEKAGFNVILGIDVWKDALSTFRHNHQDSKVLEADLSVLVPENIKPLIENKKIDVIIGGPPVKDSRLPVSGLSMILGIGYIKILYIL